MSSLSDLANLLRGRPTVVLSGAGISTESGIPDYRGPQSARRTRKPLTYREFVQSEENRRRYWARSASGWERVSGARPNPAHLAVARLERHGNVIGVITQNVDGLHQQAGSRRVIELHGALGAVRCMDCGAEEDRGHLQLRLEAHNPGWDFHGATAAPDGDAELSAVPLGSFVVPGCLACGGTLRPDVIFFGENVPAARVQTAFHLLDEGSVLLVAGSSLAVYSGLRFVHRAAERGMPVAIANQGPTRGDPLAGVRVDGWLGEILPWLADEMLLSS